MVLTGFMRNELFWIKLSGLQLLAYYHIKPSFREFTNNDVINYSSSISNSINLSSFASANLADGYRHDKLFLLHERLGHLSNSIIKECIKNDLFVNSGLKNKDCRKEMDHPLCDICARAKLTRTVFNKIHKIRGNNFGDYVSVDIASFPSIPSRNGYKYVLTFIDHASKKSYVFPLKTRSGADIFFV